MFSKNSCFSFSFKIHTEISLLTIAMPSFRGASFVKNVLNLERRMIALRNCVVIKGLLLNL